MPGEPYTRNYYEWQRAGAARSAEIVIPLLLELLPVQSVVDVGCGVGSWLAVFRKRGVADVLGVDGGYVDRELLQIPQDCFKAWDLASPLSLTRVFDLAMSLEVAEHLPPECAAPFVESLTRLAPAVLFSAAIPFQIGLHHVNEQWQEKWAELFREHEYLPVDFIRRQIWQNEEVEPWYVQNTLLFVRAEMLERNSALEEEYKRTSPSQLSIVHPRQYLILKRHLEAQIPTESPKWGVADASRIFLSSLKNAIGRRLRFRRTGRSGSGAKGHGLDV